MSMELLSGDLDDLTKVGNDILLTSRVLFIPTSPKEVILNDVPLQYTTQSDIFSLGATMYEICLGRPLPENGQEWQDIRHGILQPMPNTPFELQMIVRNMLAPEKESRPSAADLLKKRQLMSSEQQQLILERNKANAANMALNQMVCCFACMVSCVLAVCMACVLPLYFVRAKQRIQSSASPRKKFHRSNTVC